MSDTTDLERWHGVIVEAYDRLVKLAEEGYAGGWPESISYDTVMSIGQATGGLSKARALLRRDIDQRR